MAGAREQIERVPEARNDSDEHHDDQDPNDVHVSPLRRRLSIVPSLRLKFGRRVLAPAWGPTLVVLPLLALLLSAGMWQLRRAAEKEALWDSFAHGADRAVELPRAVTPPARYTHVRLTGRYLAAYPFLLDNMSHAGQPGYRVLTPFERQSGETILIDRGFIPRGRAVPSVAELAAGGEERTLTGRADLLPRRGIELTGPRPPERWPKVVSYPHLDELERELKRPLHPNIILLDAQEPDGFLRDWQPPGLPPERHSAYALTWFALALTLLVLYVRLSLRPAP